MLRTRSIDKVVLHVHDDKRYTRSIGHDGAWTVHEGPFRKKNGVQPTDENRIRTCAVRDQTLATASGVESVILGVPDNHSGTSPTFRNLRASRVLDAHAVVAISSRDLQSSPPLPLRRHACGP